MNDDRGPGSRPTGSALNALFRMGAGASRMVASAVTGTEQSRSDVETPLQEVIRHTTTVAGVLIAGTVKAAKAAGLGVGASEPTGGGSTSGAGKQGPVDSEETLPVLQRGEELRIPLSVDNRSNEAMIGLVPRLIGVRSSSDQPSTAVKAAFTPERLDIAPRDFEKVTITLRANRNAAPGIYVVRFALGEEPLEIRIRLR